jgi:hypothetical protein
MSENIKNVDGLIHFRVYKHNVILDKKENKIRCGIFLTAASIIPLEIISEFLIQKRIKLMNEALILEENSDEICLNKHLQFRLRCITKFLINNKYLDYQVSLDKLRLKQ